MSLEAIVYKDGKLEILDQLLIPAESKYMKILTLKDAFNAIKDMNVRGAPAIAIVGVLAVVVELIPKKFENIEEIINFVSTSLDYMVSARPTAVNIVFEASKLKSLCKTLLVSASNVEDFKAKLIEDMTTILPKDVQMNRSIGDFGARHILDNNLAIKSSNGTVKILTHCNTGSLATGGYGTALGVIRRLNELNKIEHVFCTETRPYNQGSRLTAFELVYEKIPATLVCDNMVALLLSKKSISAIVVGADRIVSNGDTANKIGTYQLAILAKHFNIPFYVAAPLSTIDFSKKHGSEIVIEERSGIEITHMKGIQIAAPGIQTWNPAFDITPHELITGGIITEFGTFKANELEANLKKAV